MENHVTSGPSPESRPLTTAPEVRQRVPQLPLVDPQQAARARRRNTMVTGAVLLVVAMAGGLFYRLGSVEKQVVWKTHEVTRGEMVVSDNGVPLVGTQYRVKEIMEQAVKSTLSRFAKLQLLQASG